MKELSLNLTLDKLKGPTKEQLIFHNQWASIGLDKFHKGSKAVMEFVIDGITRKTELSWDSNFPKAAMREEVDIAHHGGVAMAWFVMSVLLDYRYVQQSEIGDGVDYLFQKTEPDDDDLNFLSEHHYVEISGILRETRTNTLNGRIKSKHGQICKGCMKDKPSSVIITLFNAPKTIKEIHI